MKTVRRLYFYIVCAAALPLVLSGLGVGIKLFFTQLLNAILGTGNEFGFAMSLVALPLALALLLIATPFYGIHWFIAERDALRDPDEATAGVRHFYLYFTLTWMLIRILNLAYYLTYNLLSSALQVEQETWFNLPQPTAPQMLEDTIWLVLYIGMVAYHAYLLNRDNRKHGEPEFSGGLRRLVTYGFAAGGVLMFAAFVSNMILLIGNLVREETVRWAALTVSELPRLLVSLPLWLVPWVWANWRFGKKLPGEVDSTVRQVFLYLSVFFAVLVALGNLTTLLSGLFANLLQAPFRGNIFYLLAMLVPSVGIWVYHAVVLGLDSRAAPTLNQQSNFQRLYNYQLAAIGFAAFLTGIGGLISLLITLLFRAAEFNVDLRQSLAWYLAGLIVGLALWLYHFLPTFFASRGESETAIRERSSLIRRIYYAFFLLLASLTVLSTAITVFYQFFMLFLGLRTTDGLVADIALAAAYLLVTIVVGVSHGAVIFLDSRANQAYQRQRLSQATVVFFTSEDEAFDETLRTRLAQRLPELKPHWLPAAYDPSATPAPTADTDDDSPLPPTPVALINTANLIFAPSDAFTNRPADALTWQPLLADSTATQLLLPTAASKWRIPDFTHTRPNQIAESVIRTLERFVDRQSLEGRQSRSVGEIIGIVIGILVAILFFALPITLLLTAANL